MAPADAETICLFAQFLARSFKAPQSILNYVASVKLWHTLLDLDTSLFNSIEFKLPKKGLLRSVQHIIRQAAPMTPQILRRIRQKLKLHNPADATYWALFLIAFFTMAWKSNLVPDTAASFNPEKQLSRQKILVGDGCLLVFWTWAKNIQNRDRAYKIPLLQIPGSPLCPVAAYRTCAILSLWKNTRLPSQLFPVPAQSRLHTRSSMVNSNNWSKHAASTQTITQHTVFGGVGPHALSERKYPIHWFSCKGTGCRTATKDI